MNVKAKHNEEDVRPRCAKRNADGSMEDPQAAHPGWDFGEDKAQGGRSFISYLGVDYVTGKKEVQWRHTQTNVEAWQQDFDEFRAAAEPTCRQVATLVGILLWDARVSGKPLGGIFTSLDLMSKIGTTLAREEDSWDSAAPLDKEELAELVIIFEEFMRRATSRIFEIRQLGDIRRSIIEYIAVDASDFGGAAVRLNDQGVEPELLWTKQWNDQMKRRSINYRETITAINGIRRILQRYPQEQRRSLRIVLAEDNTTALAAINALYYPRNGQLCGELFSLHSELATALATAVYEPTKKMPADLPSRMKLKDATPEEIDDFKAKCWDCRRRLEEMYPADQGRKRARDEDAQQH